MKRPLLILGIITFTTLFLGSVASHIQAYPKPIEEIKKSSLGSCDEDGDGFFASDCGGQDCDDTEADINPDSQEVCDDVDNDCDGNIDELLVCARIHFDLSNKPSTLSDAKEINSEVRRERDLPQLKNQSPQADAGEDQTVSPGETVTLDGSGSYDPDDETLTYSWQETSTSATELATPLEETTTLKAPSSDGTYTFKLYVMDGNGGIDSDEMILTVKTEPSAEEGAGASTTNGGINFEGGGCSLQSHHLKSINVFSFLLTSLITFFCFLIHRHFHHNLTKVSKENL